MRTSRMLIAMLLVLVLFLAGCGDKAPLIDTTTPFIGGSNGILASFVSGAPPDFVFDNGNYPFGISVKLENVGESGVAPEDGYVEIIGINPMDFGLASQSDLRRNFPTPLEGARKNFDGTVIPGGQVLVEFGELRYIPDLHGNTDVTIRANLCYNYKTQTTTKICIKGDLLRDITGGDVCVVNEEKRPQNSGGPIQITELREAPIGTEKIQLTFKIEQTGEASGNFYAISASRCDNTITNPERNVVFVNVKSDINGRMPQCVGLEMSSADRASGYVRLFDGQPRIVTCTLDITGIESTYEDLFEVDLEYKYEQSIEKRLQIRDVSMG